jgi:hypothetical protein
MRISHTLDREPVGNGRMPVPVASGCSSWLWGNRAHRSEVTH